MKLTKLKLCIVSLLLTACTSEPITVEQYWYKKGQRIGEVGIQDYGSSIEHFEKKGDFNESAFHKGYSYGKSLFCDPFQAFDKGLSGRKYSNQCEGVRNELLIRAEWQRGWQVFIGKGNSMR
ncbi:DUF2799 domain-containing protein [Vibrio sp. E150_011]